MIAITNTRKDAIILLDFLYAIYAKKANKAIPGSKNGNMSRKTASKLTL